MRIINTEPTIMKRYIFWKNLIDWKIKRKMLTMKDTNEKWHNTEKIMMNIIKQQPDSLEGQIIKFNQIMEDTRTQFQRSEFIEKREKSNEKRNIDRICL